MAFSWEDERGGLVVAWASFFLGGLGLLAGGSALAGCFSVFLVGFCMELAGEGAGSVIFSCFLVGFPLFFLVSALFCLGCAFLVVVFCLFAVLALHLAL